MYTCISYHITYTNVVPKRDMVTCVNKLPLEFALIILLINVYYLLHQSSVYQLAYLHAADIL